MFRHPFDTATGTLLLGFALTAGLVAGVRFLLG